MIFKEEEQATPTFTSSARLRVLDSSEGNLMVDERLDTVGFLKTWTLSVCCKQDKELNAG